MEKKFDVTALGELLIDFTENGVSPQGNPILEANPGGAVCNVLSMLNQLGHTTGFIGKVGDDMFGEQLTRALEEVHIATEGLVKDREVPTTLAFVHTLPGGDRDFSFYRNPGADMMLGKEEVNVSMVELCRIFHFGSLSMTDKISREATAEHSANCGSIPASPLQTQCKDDRLLLASAGQSTAVKLHNLSGNGQPQPCPCFVLPP